MNNQLNDISRIYLFLQGERDRINEVAVFGPLNRHVRFDVEGKPLTERTWHSPSNLPFSARISLKVKTFVFKYFSFLTPKRRLTPEAKLKTILAILLSQEDIRNYMLQNDKSRKEFYSAIEKTAHTIGVPDFSFPKNENPLEISRHLTTLDGEKKSLVDDLQELHLQIASLPYSERNEILYQILNLIERAPITSIIEVSNHLQTLTIPITTKYSQYKVVEQERASGKITYKLSQNHATSSIRTLANFLPNRKGAANQRVAIDQETGRLIGSYCGELSTPFHTLEQILLILGETGEEAYLLHEAPQGIHPKEVKIFFTSLFSWNELGILTEEHQAVEKWNQKILKCGDQYFFLSLQHFNISFSAFNKYPTPQEIGATIKDINDEALITISYEVFRKLGIESDQLDKIALNIMRAKKMDDSLFIEKQKCLLENIDLFRELKPTFISMLEQINSSICSSLKAILSGKKEDGKKLKGIDLLLYLDHVVTELGYTHNKNCQNATDRSAGADAADKAQYAYQKIKNAIYLPGQNENEEEKILFQVLYSLYLVWEEPEINTALSTGFWGEKFHKSLILKNPETTRYLVEWLKKHPEFYLGLSRYRS